MPRIGLLFDSVSKNTGDEAIGIALKQQLESYGDVSAEVINPFEFSESDFDAVIVGGGQLIRQEGDDYYDIFRLKGKHILNTVGLLEPVDKLDYLKDYELVSVRTQREADVIKAYRADVECLPCVTTKLSHKGHEYSIDKLKGEKLVGIHLVPHSLELCPNLVNIINGIKHRKVFIPFTHYNLDKNFMESLPLDFSNSIVLPELQPEQLHSVIGQMDYTVVSSLHASIFSYTQNIPFATLGQQKVVDYFTDRGLGNFVYSSDDQLESIVRAIEDQAFNFSERVKKEKLQVKKYLDRFYNIAKKNETANLQNRHTGRAQSRTERNYKDYELQLEIARHTIKGRDRLIGQQARRIAQEDHNIKVLQNDKNTLITELIKSIEASETIKQSKTFKLGNALAHPHETPGRLVELAQRRRDSLKEQRLNKKDILDCKKIYEEMHREMQQYKKPDKKYAIILHLYFTDMWDYFKDKLNQLDLSIFDIYITVPYSKKSEVGKKILKDFSQARVLGVPNRGRDVLPFLEVCKGISRANYRAILKIHSKKSIHREDGNKWLNSIIDNLIPKDKSTQEEIFSIFNNPETAVVGPTEQYVYLAVNYEANKKHIKGIILDLFGDDMVNHIDKNRFDYGFFAGTMFWFNPEHIQNLVNKNYSCENFEFENGSIDSTFAHSVERVFTLSPEIEGAVVYGINNSAIKKLSYNAAILPEWSDVHVLLSHIRNK